MAQLLYSHCRHCGDRLDRNDSPYCAPCNLYLAYRAMPILLGMLFTGQMKLAKAGSNPSGNWAPSRIRQDHGDIFPCKSRLCGVSPSVTELCDCTAAER